MLVEDGWRHPSPSSSCISGQGRGTEETLTLAEVEAALLQMAEGVAADQLAHHPSALAWHERQDKCETSASKLFKAEARYRALVEQLPAVTFMAPLDGSTGELYVSPQIENLLGFSAAEWLSDPILWFRQLHPDDRDRWHGEFVQTVNSGKPFRAEYRFLARDGRLVWVHGEAQVVRDERGCPLFLQGIAFDITDRKLAEETRLRMHDELEIQVCQRTAQLDRANDELHAEIRVRVRAEEAARRANADLAKAHDHALEASRIKSTFLANMSHELRTPLNAIIGYSELLQELSAAGSPGTFRADLGKINQAGKHLLTLINDVLDISKIEAGKTQLYLETFAIADLIHEVATTVQPLVARNDNRLELNADDTLGTMHADLTRVRQCFFNLLSNACKFTRQGTIVLTAVRETVDDRDWLLFRVRDSGIGMTPEQIGRLFQAFAQADASTTRKYGGTGLGLALTQRLCQLMGGDIFVESGLNQGSTFTLRLPAQVVDATAVASAPALATATASPDRVAGVRQTILVIDDDPVVPDLLKGFLDPEVFAVVSAADGREGLHCAAQVRPAAIVLDVLMPGLDGWATLTALKADADLASIPVVLLTISDDKNRGFALGAADYLTKPFDPKLLVSVLKKYQGTTSLSRVLLVEDDDDARTIARRMFQQAGWTVSEAANGRLGLASVAAQPPSLILLDLMMPEMDGFEFVRELRTTEVGRSIPVVVVTAKDITEEDRRRLSGNTVKILHKRGSHCEELLGQVRDLLHVCARPDSKNQDEG